MPTKLLEHFIHSTLVWSDIPERIIIINNNKREKKRDWEPHLVDVLVQLGVEDRLSEQHDRLRAAHRRELLSTDGLTGFAVSSPAQGS